MSMSVISDEELERLRNVLDSGTALLAVSPAQLFLSNINANGTGNSELSRILRKLQEEKNEHFWTKTSIQGWLSFICDSEGIYSFKIHSFKKLSEHFSVNLAYDLDYRKQTDSFHFFASEQCLVAFNFADAVEAGKFLAVVTAKLPTDVSNIMKVTKEDRELVKKSKRDRARGRSRNSKLGSVKRMSKSRAQKVSKFIRNSKLLRKSKRFFRKRRSEDDLLFSPSELTDEWKQVLKEAGIKEKDFKKKKMQKLIAMILKEQGIAVTVPQLSDEAAQKAYNSEELKKYNKYKEEEKQYEKDYEEYVKQTEDLKTLDGDANTTARTEGNFTSTQSSTNPKHGVKYTPAKPNVDDPEDIPNLFAQSTPFHDFSSSMHSAPDLPPPPPVMPRMPVLPIVKDDVEVEQDLDEFLDGAKSLFPVDFGASPPPLPVRTKSKRALELLDDVNSEDVVIRTVPAGSPPQPLPKNVSETDILTPTKEMRKVQPKTSPTKQKHKTMNPAAGKSRIQTLKMRDLTFNTIKSRLPDISMLDTRRFSAITQRLYEEVERIRGNKTSESDDEDSVPGV